MTIRPRLAAALFAAIATGLIGTAAFAQVRPALPHSAPAPVTMATLHPAASPTAASALRTVSSLYVGAVAAGTVVPKGRLPMLPFKTAANTETGKEGRETHFRRLSATGATITVVTNGANSCQTTVGDFFNIGCEATWQSSGLTTLAADDYQDYIFAPGSATGTATGGTYKGPTGTAHAIAAPGMVNGTYVFGVYDTASQKWVTVTYVTAGAPFSLTVYEDPYHTTPENQFDATGSTNAYIYLQDVTASDNYVIYIESTSVNPVCVFTAPAQNPTPSPTGTGSLCNPSESPGETAPGGNLAVTWPIPNTTAAGTYSIVAYDLTAGMRIGQVQVAVTGPSGATMTLDESITGANTQATPSPMPARTPGSGTIFAWDGSGDQSVAGVTEESAGLPSDTYIWSINDPDGTVAASSNAGTISGAVNHTFAFASATLDAPGDYPSNILTADLYNSTAATMYSAQAFRIVGYNTTTLFQSASQVASINVPAGGSASTTLLLENTSGSDFGISNGDSLASVAFTTGTDFLANNANGDGIEMALSGSTLAQCASASGCELTSVTATDGTSWTVYDFCSAATPGAKSECYLVTQPNSNGGALSSGATIDIPLTFYAATGNACTATCLGRTIELPYHGVEWSNLTSNLAWEPVYFTDSTGLSGTASVALYGAVLAGTEATPAPAIEAHGYRPPTAMPQAIYLSTSPYTENTTVGGTLEYANVFALKINNTSTTSAITEFAVAEPGPEGSDYTEQYIAIDSKSSADWEIVACPNNLSAQFFCIERKGTTTIAAGASATIYLQQTETPVSYTYTDWVIQSVAPNSFPITASGETEVPASTVQGTEVDTLALSAYSLTANEMSATWSPASASGSTADETINITNTSLAADPNPDYLDNIIVLLPNGYTVSGISTSTPGWVYVGEFYSNTLAQNVYWFSTCSSAQDSATYEPPATTPLTSTSLATQLPACTYAQWANALAPGQTFSAAMTIGNLNNANLTGTMYAHGANGGGWSLAKTFTLVGSTISASVGFTKAGGYPTGATVATNTVPTIGGNPNATFGNNFVYAVKNSAVSNGQNITSFAVIIPGEDINTNNAWDGTETWTLTTTPTLSGNTDGCTVLGSASAQENGTSGYINIGGGSCSLKPGDTIDITFDAIGPQTESDSYLFDTQNINGTGTLDSLTAQGTTGGETWEGDSRIQVALQVGLNVIMDPSNPGPGGSTPSVSCPGCAFSGSTVDLGTIGSNTSATFGDLVDASVNISSTTAVTWSLSVETNSNPTRSPGSPTNELLTDVDSTNSTQTGVTFDQTGYAVIPTASGLTIANGTSVTTRTQPYDVLQNFEVSIGNESIAPQVSTVTYTLVAN